MAEVPVLSAIESLPDDALLEILKHVPNSDLAVNVSEVSRRMRDVAVQRSLWKHVRITGYSILADFLDNANEPQVPLLTPVWTTSSWTTQSPSCTPEPRAS